MDRAAAVPPAGVVVVFRRAVEAEGEVVEGADPLGRIDLAGGELRRRVRAR